MNPGLTPLTAREREALNASAAASPCPLRPWSPNTPTGTRCSTGTAGLGVLCIGLTISYVPESPTRAQGTFDVLGAIGLTLVITAILGVGIGLAYSSLPALIVGAVPATETGSLARHRGAPGAGSRPV